MPNAYQLEPIDESNLGAEKKTEAVPEVKPVEQTEQVPRMETEKPEEVIPAEKDVAYGKILSQVKSQSQATQSDEEIKSDADLAYQKTDAESQIQHLVDLAMNKGVIHAVKVARHMEDNYVLDMMHDKLLADELHDALMKKGLIKEM